MKPKLKTLSCLMMALTGFYVPLVHAELNPGMGSKDLPFPAEDVVSSDSAALPDETPHKLNLPLNLGLEYIQGSGLVADAQINKQFNRSWAASALAQYGANLYRFGGTLGAQVGVNNLFKLSVETLSEVLPFQFDSGNINQRVNQNALGARYQRGLELRFVDAINVGAYYAKANNMSLEPVLYTGADSFNYVDFRNLAGGASAGSDLGVIKTVGTHTQLNAHVYYDQVNYSTLYNGNLYNRAGLGVSGGVTQLLSSQLKLNIDAGAREIYSSLQATVSLLPQNFSKYHTELSFNVGRFMPTNGMPSTNSVALQLGCSLEREASASHHFALINPSHADLASWIEDPAVRMRQVLVTSDQLNLGTL